MPNLLLTPDQRGWIFDFLCTYEADFMRKQGWHVDIIYQNEPFITPLKPKEYDLVFNPSYSPRPFEKQFRGKLIRGIFGHKWAWTTNPKEALDRSLKNTVGLIVPNYELKKMLEWYYPRTYQVVEGTDPKIFYFKKFNDTPYLVAAWTGNPHHTWKGLEEIIIPACKKADVELRVATDLNRTDLNDFYNDVDVVLVATKNEGSPNCVFEAGACHRPIIGTKAGIIPEAIIDGKNGFIIERSVDAFAQKLIWAKANKIQLREMGAKHNKVVIQKFTIDEHCRQFSEVVNHLYNIKSNGLKSKAPIYEAGISKLKRFVRKVHTKV